MGLESNADNSFSNNTTIEDKKDTSQIKLEKSKPYISNIFSELSDGK